MAQILPQIKHIVVVMLENRSFDNLCGWIYSDPQGPQPSLFLPAGSPAVYDGLNASFWNPANKSYFDANEPPVKVPVVQGTTDFTVPSPDPEETFDNVTYQLYGPQGPDPSPTWPMQGFVVNYQDTKVASPDQIMQTYSPAQLPVLTALAQNFAISDAWFCSVPSQTWPNRSFVHAGTSNGNVDNGVITNPFHWDVMTIFNVLQSMGASWKVYNDSFTSSLTRIMFPKLWSPLLNGHFRGFQRFSERLRGRHASSVFVRRARLLLGGSQRRASSARCRRRRAVPVRHLAGDQSIARLGEHAALDHLRRARRLLRSRLAADQRRRTRSGELSGPGGFSLRSLWSPSARDSHFALHPGRDRLPLAHPDSLRPHVGAGHASRLAAHPVNPDAAQPAHCRRAHAGSGVDAVHAANDLAGDPRPSGLAAADAPHAAPQRPAKEHRRGHRPVSRHEGRRRAGERSARGRTWPTSAHEGMPTRDEFPKPNAVVAGHETRAKRAVVARSPTLPGRVRTILEPKKTGKGGSINRMLEGHLGRT